MLRPTTAILSASLLCLLSACGAASELGAEYYGTTPGGDAGLCDGGRCYSGTYRSYNVTSVSAPFVDACAVPGHTTLLVDQDDATESFALPFDLRFFRSFGRAAWVSSNGILGFGSTASSVYRSSCTENLIGDPALFAFWDDLHTRSTGVCTATVGTAPLREFVVTWSDMSFCCSDPSTTHLTFSAVVQESTDVLTVVYQTMRDDNPTAMARATGLGAVLGVQDQGGVSSMRRGCMQEGVATSGSAVRYTPVP